MKRVNYVCATCGSDDVGRDAYAEWNPETQAWELRSTFDQAYCFSPECGKETTLKTVPYEGEG